MGEKGQRRSITKQQLLEQQLDELKQVEERISALNIFKGHTAEKKEELADAIYMCALRSKLPVSTAVELIRAPRTLDEAFFKKSHGNIFDYVHRDYQEFAKRLFLKKAGGGTPNAAMGKAELLLLLFSDKTRKPQKGDIEFDGRQIEIKTNGGKAGLGSGITVNKQVADFCKKSRITLPLAARGKTAKGQPQFDPTDESHRRFLGKNLSKVLAVWWEAVSGETLPAKPKVTWERVRNVYLTRVASNLIQDSSHSELLVFDAKGNFRFFKNPTAFVKYYDTPRTRFEIRGYQTNPIAIDLLPENSPELN